MSTETWSSLNALVTFVLALVTVQFLLQNSKTGIYHGGATSLTQTLSMVSRQDSHALNMS